MFYKLLMVMLGAFFVWRLFIFIKAHPEALSKNNLARSFFSMGILALLLMVFIAGLVFIIRK